MRTSTKIAPPNSLLFIADPNGGTTPQITNKRPNIWSTPSCIAVGCLAFINGKTDVTLGDKREVDPGDLPAFDGQLETPNREVLVSTAEWETVLKSNVPNISTRIRIWVNHPTEPDKVIIGLG